MRAKKISSLWIIILFLLVAASYATTSHQISIIKNAEKKSNRTISTLFLGDQYDAPVYQVGDQWSYDMNFEYESSALETIGKVKDYTIIVKDVKNDRYKTEISGNVHGKGGIFGIIPIGSVSGTVSGYAYMGKEDIAYIKFLIHSGGKVSGGVFTYDIDTTLTLNPPWVYIDFPVKVGDKWYSSTKAALEMDYKIKTLLGVTVKEGTYRDNFNINEILRCTRDHVTITTDAGTFNDALLIENSSGSKLIIRIWFSPSVGNMIKWKYEDCSDSYKIKFEMELKSFEYTYNRAPYTPENPLPNDNAKDVDVETDLFWDGGDPDSDDTVTYDIYFGKTQNLQKIGSISRVATERRITYNLNEKLDYNTDYYWKIVAKDDKGHKSVGPLWCFTTKENTSNNPPYKPSNPSPADGETGINISEPIFLSWDGGDPDSNDTVTYEIYLDKNSDPSTKVHTFSKPATETRPSFELGMNLDRATKYYWKVIATDSKGASRESSTWNFATEGYSPDNKPPYKPSNPSPQDKKDGIGLNPRLSWYGGDPDSSDTVRYDIYIGTSNNSLQKKDSLYKPATLQQIFYDLENLWEKTWYYWQIVATDNHGASVKGPIWSFKTKVVDDEPPFVQIKKPIEGVLYINDAERFNRGFISIYFKHPVIIGPITIEVVAADNVEGGIAKVEIFIDDELKYEGSQPYGIHQWKWSEKIPVDGSHWHTIKAVAYDTSGNSAQVEMRVWKIF
jgi:hypothetical protein